MIERRPLETHAVVGERPQERDERRAIPGIDADPRDIPVEPCVREVALPHVEVHGLRQGGGPTGMK
jgi:hypothetical protein